MLLLDEPLSALDKNLRQDMQVELKTLQQTLGLTTIFVTHDQEEALSLSDRVVVMNKGEIEQLDTPANIYNQPVSEYVARFVGEAFFFRGRVEGGYSGLALRQDDGKLIPIKGEALEAGQEAIAFVRPEWVDLSKLDVLLEPEAPQGIVDRLMFFGQSSDYLVNISDRQMRVKRRNDGKGFSSGEAVALRFIARALPESGAGA
ncbi:hypothetical protein AQY21_05005 [Paracoccus sp. MKU1]|nr:hypothetical protein AQY21_05005 [Paracoccus sp. MKU1]